MALRETAMTAPLDQQGEPWAANGRPPLAFTGNFNDEKSLPGMGRPFDLVWNIR